MSMSEKADFATVYEENFKYVYNFVYMKVLHKEIAEDLTEDTFIKALDAYDRYDPAVSGVRTWLCTIARNTVINHQTSAAKRHEEMTDVLPEPDTAENNPVEEHIEFNELNREVEDILKELSREERELLSMRYAMDLQVKDIADILGINPKAATERIRRLLEKCRKIHAKVAF